VIGRPSVSTPAHPQRQIVASVPPSLSIANDRSLRKGPVQVVADETPRDVVARTRTGIPRTGSPCDHTEPTVVGSLCPLVQRSTLDALGTKMRDEEGNGDPHHENPPCPRPCRPVVGLCGVPYRRLVRYGGVFEVLWVG